MRIPAFPYTKIIHFRPVSKCPGASVKIRNHGKARFLLLFFILPPPEYIAIHGLKTQRTHYTQTSTPTQAAAERAESPTNTQPAVIPPHRKQQRSGLKVQQTHNPQSSIPPQAAAKRAESPTSALHADIHTNASSSGAGWKPNKHTTRGHTHKRKQQRSGLKAQQAHSPGQRPG